VEATEEDFLSGKCPMERENVQWREKMSGGENVWWREKMSGGERKCLVERENVRWKT